MGSPQYFYATAIHKTGLEDSEAQKRELLTHPVLILDERRKKI